MDFRRLNDSRITDSSTTKSACNLAFQSKQSFVTVPRTPPKKLIGQGLAVRNDDDDDDKELKISIPVAGSFI